MRVSARSDYAVRALIEVAGRPGEPVTADQVSRAQGIPLKFLLGILGDLRRSGLVRSQRGPSGGYLMDREPESITVADIMRAVDGPLASVQGSRPESMTYPGSAARLQEVWVALRASLRTVLEAVTLADLVSGDLPPVIAELTRDAEAWSRR
ncbi:MAG TPA: Rrf2 family transcriptional regulator [Frankiaceae bacterium]|nr:Rrf2 family transcriptional regulator [Frankiaceae bacterium]